MFRKLMIVVVASLALYAVAAGAHPGMKMDKASGAKATKMSAITGEVVDTGCYMAHEAKGEKHVECATKCINNGMPMGLLTAKGDLYLITLDHDNPDGYNKLKSMAGKTVTITGATMSRGGMKGIDATAVKEQMAAAAK